MTPYTPPKRLKMSQWHREYELFGVSVHLQHLAVYSKNLLQSVGVISIISEVTRTNSFGESFTVFLGNNLGDA